MYDYLKPNPNGPTQVFVVFNFPDRPDIAADFMDEIDKQKENPFPDGIVSFHFSGQNLWSLPDFHPNILVVISGSSKFPSGTCRYRSVENKIFIAPIEGWTTGESTKKTKSAIRRTITQYWMYRVGINPSFVVDQLLAYVDSVRVSVAL